MYKAQSKRYNIEIKYQQIHMSIDKPQNHNVEVISFANKLTKKWLTFTSTLGNIY